jgi:hypothetical protein
MAEESEGYDATVSNLCSFRSDTDPSFGQDADLMHPVLLHIGSRDPIRLTADEAGDLSRALWRLGERDGLKGSITLSAAVLEGRQDGRAVVVGENDLPSLREALRRLGYLAKLSGNLAALNTRLQ